MKAVVGITDATKIIKNGQRIRVEINARSVLIIEEQAFKMLSPDSDPSNSGEHFVCFIHLSCSPKNCTSHHRNQPNGPYHKAKLMELNDKRLILLN